MPTELSCNVLERNCRRRSVAPSPGTTTRPTAVIQWRILAVISSPRRKRKNFLSCRRVVHVVPHDLTGQERVKGCDTVSCRMMLSGLGSDMPVWRRLPNGSLSGGKVGLMSRQKKREENLNHPVWHFHLSNGQNKFSANFHFSVHFPAITHPHFCKPG